MTEDGLRERVEVDAIFNGDNRKSPCSIVSFTRKNKREVFVSEIGLYHKLWNGTKCWHIFEIIADGVEYRLELDSARLSWWLTREVSSYE